uniref:Uncharacterized protein n=1 Tax=Amphimedon queenslandica TaxID=400682 RepID=A0A1X7UYQ0_AMPQE
MIRLLRKKNTGRRVEPDEPKNSLPQIGPQSRMTEAAMSSGFHSPSQLLARSDTHQMQVPREVLSGSPLQQGGVRPVHQGLVFNGHPRRVLPSIDLSQERGDPGKLEVSAVVMANDRFKYAGSRSICDRYSLNICNRNYRLPSITQSLPTRNYSPPVPEYIPFPNQSSVLPPIIENTVDNDEEQELEDEEIEEDQDESVQESNSMSCQEEEEDNAPESENPDEYVYIVKETGFSRAVMKVKRSELQSRENESLNNAIDGSELLPEYAATPASPCPARPRSSIVRNNKSCSKRRKYRCSVRPSLPTIPEDEVVHHVSAHPVRRATIDTISEEEEEEEEMLEVYNELENILDLYENLVDDDNYEEDEDDMEIKDCESDEQKSDEELSSEGESSSESLSDEESSLTEEEEEYITANEENEEADIERKNKNDTVPFSIEADLIAINEQVEEEQSIITNEEDVDETDDTSLLESEAHDISNKIESLLESIVGCLVDTSNDEKCTSDATEIDNDSKTEEEGVYIAVRMEEYNGGDDYTTEENNEENDHEKQEIDKMIDDEKMIEVKQFIERDDNEESIEYSLVLLNDDSNISVIINNTASESEIEEIELIDVSLEHNDTFDATKEDNEEMNDDDDDDTSLKTEVLSCGPVTRDNEDTRTNIKERGRRRKISLKPVRRLLSKIKKRMKSLFKSA